MKSRFYKFMFLALFISVVHPIVTNKVSNRYVDKNKHI